MIKRFIGQKLTDVQTGQGGCPVSFFWKGHEYQVSEILKQWQDFDYTPLAPRRNWRTRRHRNAFQVRTESGECFELICDRGTKLSALKQWMLRSVLKEEDADSDLSERE